MSKRELAGIITGGLVVTEVVAALVAPAGLLTGAL